MNTLLLFPVLIANYVFRTSPEHRLCSQHQFETTNHVLTLKSVLSLSTD